VVPTPHSTRWCYNPEHHNLNARYHEYL
jgi:hypothetical protein